jgi:hypothetical protein
MLVGRAVCRSIGNAVTSARVPSVFAIACLALLQAGCDDVLDATNRARDHITFEQLTGSGDIAETPLDNSYFTPMGKHAPALHQLAGFLEIGNEGHVHVDYGFPAFRARFFTHNGHLIPVERDIIKGNSDTWDLILSPGRVWSEETDDGWSRASFPFTLTGKIWNESHNGLATFLYNDTGVSRIAVQIVQEAASWDQFDGWAELSLGYTAEDANGFDDLRASFGQELAERIPIRRWHELEDSPVDSPAHEFDGTAVNVTVSGLVIDGVFYGQPCRTRHGDYPYCGEMRHGVYSVTKTAGAAISLFWLAHVYGDEVYGALITDYVNVTAKHKGWDGVTFLDALNMTTGVGDLAPDRNAEQYVFEADDDGPTLEVFANAPHAKAKLDVVFGNGNYPWGPGEVGRYNTMHTFVLAAAMDAYLKRRQGPDVNLWDAVLESVLKPIGVRHAPMMHTREPDDNRGIPIMGYGYFPTIGELAKIALLIEDGGQHDGRQLLDGSVLSELFDSPETLGYTIPWDNSHGRYRYDKSFWFMPFDVEGGCSYMLPEMIGFGGNVVQLLPRNMVAIRFADGADDSGGNPNGESMAEIAQQIRPLCD